MEQLSLFQDEPQPVAIAKELAVYTDGGCSGNPGPGGWGCVILDLTETEKNKERIFSGGRKLTTNNQMELTAVIEALKVIVRDYANNSIQVSVFTDSQYVKNGITTWIKNWKRNGWRTADKSPVKNKELWLELDSLTQQLSLRWVWVKGHAGVHYNEVVDKLTQDEIARFR